MSPSRRQVGSRSARRWWRWLLPVFGLGLVTLVFLFLHRPGWWVEAGDSSPAAVARGRGLEQALSREFTQVREQENWGFVLGEEDLNAWLANRLVPWADSRENVSLPEGFSDPRIRFGDGWVEVGLLADQIGLGIMSTIRFEVRLEDGDLVFLPAFARLGPLDLTERGLGSLEAYARGDDRLRFDGSGEVRVSAVVPLLDGRRVLVKDLELVPGEMAVRLQTLGP